MFELKSLGAILTSYDVETRLLNSNMADATMVFASIALGMTIVFCMLEGVEIMKVGVLSYAQDMWNVMDWLNFILYFFVFAHLMAVRATEFHPTCTSYLCRDVGYFDDWEVMNGYRTVKTLLSMCVCIILLKVHPAASRARLRRLLRALTSLTSLMSLMSLMSFPYFPWRPCCDSHHVPGALFLPSARGL